MPTFKQKEAFRKISENIGKLKPEPLGIILASVGYAPSVAESPKLVTESKGFKELLEETGVTDAELGRVLKEGLTATKPVYKNNNKTGKIESVADTPDFAVRHKYLETGLKLRGHSEPPAPPPAGDTYNTFIQQNNLDPNAPEPRKLVESSLEVLMAKTKRIE